MSASGRSKMSHPPPTSVWEEKPGWSRRNARNASGSEEKDIVCAPLIIASTLRHVGLQVLRAATGHDHPPDYRDRWGRKGPGAPGLVDVSADRDLRRPVVALDMRVRPPLLGDDVARHELHLGLREAGECAPHQRLIAKAVHLAEQLE